VQTRLRHRRGARGLWLPISKPALLCRQFFCTVNGTTIAMFWIFAAERSA
jgi:hypothetical protein